MILHLEHGQVDLAARRVRADGGEHALSARECALLGYLARQHGRTVGRDELTDEVWVDPPRARAVDTAVRRLRKKIEVDPSEPRHLLTDHGAGYRLVLATQAPEREPVAPRIRAGALSIDPRTGAVERDGVPIRLTPKEAALLAYLATRPGRVVGHDELRARVWGLRSSIQTRVVQNTLQRLRGRLGPDGNRLVNVWGRGYRFEGEAREAPQGAGVLVCTEVAEAWARWEHDPRAMRGAMDLHDRVLRDAIEAFDGFEVVSDARGFQIAFSRPGDALAWGARVMPQLHAVLPVRMGAHAGELVPSPHPVGGHPVYSGRIPAIASELCRAATPGRLRVGAELWEQAGPDVRPVLELHADRARLQLPRLSGELWGRDDALRGVTRAVFTHRVVAICGPSGAGKTWLAMHVAHALSGHFVRDGGAWWVDLDGADASAVGGRIARVLGLPVGDPDRLERALQTRGPTLLVLDDARAGWEAIERWSRRCPDLRILVTSPHRPPVGTAWSWALGGFPPDRALAYLERVATGPVDRDVARPLVEGLDGLPLALELAAGRLGSLPVDRLLGRLQRTDRLTAAIEWSWGELSVSSRLAVRAAAVFESGWSLEALESVVGAPVDLDELRDRSWVGPVADGRVALFQTVRAWVLANHPPDDVLRAAHVRWFADASARGVWARTEASNLWAAVRAATRLDPERALRLAGHLLRWRLVGPEEQLAAIEPLCGPDSPVRIEALLHRARVHIVAGAADLAFEDRTVARRLAVGTPDELAAAYRHAASLVDRARIDEARPILERVLREGDPTHRARARVELATAAVQAGELFEAERDLARAALEAEDLGSRELRARVLGVRAWLRKSTGDLHRALLDCEQAQALYEAIDEPLQVVALRYSAAAVRVDLVDERDRARLDLLALVDEARRTGDVWLEASARAGLASCELADGDPDRAAEHARLALEFADSVYTRAEASIFLAAAAWLTGNRAESDAWSARARQAYASLDNDVLGAVQLLMEGLAWSSDDPGRARAAVEASREGLASSPLSKLVQLAADRLDGVAVDPDWDALARVDVQHAILVRLARGMSTRS